MLENEIRQNVIVPVLKSCGLWSPAAELLVFGTGMIETNYQHIVQIGTPTNGGLGCWQIEPGTYTGLISYLRHPERKALLERICSTLYFMMLPTDPKELISNLKLGAIMCRVYYYKISAALPSEGDFNALGSYYKRWYNTQYGKADEGHCQQVFKTIIEKQ